MSFDLNILCILQEKPILSFPFQSRITFDVYNDDMNDLHKGYNYENGWRVMGTLPGFWYYLLSSETASHDTLLGSYYLCDYYNDDEMQKMDFNGNSCINDFVKMNGGITIRHSYKDEFRKVFGYLINQSPIQTVVFLARYQDEEKEYIIGTLLLDQFYSMLDKGEISFNVCYIVTGRKNLGEY